MVFAAVVGCLWYINQLLLLLLLLLLKMQSAKVVVEEEDFSFRSLVARGFPLDYLLKNYGIFFNLLETRFIQTAYLLHLYEFQHQYERGEMPKPCIGTAMELWGLLQSIFPDEYTLDEKMHDRLNKISKNHPLDNFVCQEILRQNTNDRDLSLTLNTIFEKICRKPNFIFPDEMGEFIFYENEKQMNMAQYMVECTLEYGQFPHDNVLQTYFELDDYEKYGISLLYLQLLWTCFVKHCKFVMPIPTGTAMEIFFMARISVFKSGLEGAFHHNIAAHALYQIYDRRFAEHINDLQGVFYFDRWFTKIFETVYPKISMRAYKNFLLKQKRDIHLIYGLENRLPMEMMKHVEQMYKESFIKGSHNRRRPFQFLRDGETGLWVLPRLPF